LSDDPDDMTRVLIVEDEPPIRELIRLHLSLAGFHVTEVGDGTAALDLARRQHFDLIVLDVMLPGIDGITLCRAVRVGGVNVQTPILMVTARDAQDPELILTAWGVGLSSLTPSKSEV
jgi:DNA-binding response OmpR family regulator